MEKEIIVSAAEYGIEEVKAQQIQAIFAPMLQKMTDLEAEYNEIITKERTAENCVIAGDLRRKYVKVRTSTAALHKEQKAFYLAGGRFCDALKNAQAFASQGNELKLGEFEKHFAIQEQNRIAELCEARKTELEAFGVEYIPENIGEFDEGTYSNFLLGSKTAFELKAKDEADRAAAEKKAEDERLAKEQAEAEERRIEDERIRKENEELRKQAESEKLARAEAEKKAQDKLDEERKENDRQQQLARIQAEKVEKQQQLAIKKERDQKEALQKAEDARKKAESDKAEAEKKAQDKLAKAPDKVKLFELAQTITTVDLPEMTTEDGDKILAGVRNLLGKISSYVSEKTEAM